MDRNRRNWPVSARVERKLTPEERIANSLQGIEATLKGIESALKRLVDQATSGTEPSSRGRYAADGTETVDAVGRDESGTAGPGAEP